MLENSSNNVTTEKQVLQYQQI